MAVLCTCARSTYFLQDVDAMCLVGHEVAWRVCRSKGLELAPYAELAAQGEAVAAYACMGKYRDVATN